jgi:hypothetical protein
MLLKFNLIFISVFGVTYNLCNVNSGPGKLMNRNVLICEFHSGPFLVVVYLEKSRMAMPFYSPASDFMKSLMVTSS